MDGRKDGRLSGSIHPAWSAHMREREGEGGWIWIAREMYVYIYTLYKIPSKLSPIEQYTYLQLLYTSLTFRRNDPLMVRDCFRSVLLGLNAHSLKRNGRGTSIINVNQTQPNSRKPSRASRYIPTYVNPRENQTWSLICSVQWLIQFNIRSVLHLWLGTVIDQTTFGEARNMILYESNNNNNNTYNNTSPIREEENHREISSLVWCGMGWKIQSLLYRYYGSSRV